MAGALPPQQDSRDQELPAARAGGPASPVAMLRALILALLWRGSLSQLPRFELRAPRSVSVQAGLCALVPCSFTFSYSPFFPTGDRQAPLNGHWYKDGANPNSDPPVASSDPSRPVSPDTRGRFRLAGDPTRGDCSLQISDARGADTGSYYYRMEKGDLKYSYCSNSDGTSAVLSISVPGLTAQPEIRTSPVRGLPGKLLAGEPLNVTCTAPGRCAGTPPHFTWTGPFSDTARDVSARLENGSWAHGSALSFTPGPGDDGKELGCTVTYPAAGVSTRRVLRLHVVYLPGPPSITLTRNGRPEPLAWGAEGDVVSLETCEGDSLSLDCAAKSSPQATLSWTNGNESLSPGQGGAGWLELPSLSPEDTGEYRCRAENPYGSASRALRVLVQCDRTRTLIEMSCKFVFMGTGFFLAYYLTWLYYRRTPCCCHRSRRKDRSGGRGSSVSRSTV